MRHRKTLPALIAGAVLGTATWGLAQTATGQQVVSNLSVSLVTATGSSTALALKDRFGAQGNVFYVKTYTLTANDARAAFGSDTNDCFTWATACATVYGAIQKANALPTYATSQGAEIYVADLSEASPTTGAGIWLLGGFDPNQASPPAGFLLASRHMRIIGVGGPPAQYGKTTAARVYSHGDAGTFSAGPAIWIAGTSAVLSFEHLSMYGTAAGPVVAVGLASDGTYGPITANDTFENCTFQAGGSAGPTMRYEYAFWQYLRHLAVIGNGNGFIDTDFRRSAIALRDDAAGYLPSQGAWSGATTYSLNQLVTYSGALYVSKQNGNLNHLPTDSTWWQAKSGNGPYLVFMSDISMGGGGGIWADPFTNGAGYGPQVDIDQCFEEGIIGGPFPNSQPPVQVNTTSAKIRVSNCYFAYGDGAINPAHAYDVWVNPTDGSGDPNAVTVQGPNIFGVGGPATLIGVTNSNRPGSPFSGYQQIGQNAGRITGQGQPLRNFGPTAPPWDNGAILSGVATTAPDGSQRASTSLTISTFSKYGDILFGAGDYVIFGAWWMCPDALCDLTIVERAFGTQGGISLSYTGKTIAPNSASPALSAYPAWAQKIGAAWFWHSGYLKILTGSTTPNHIEIGAFNRHIYGAMPTLYYVTAAQMTANGWTEDTIAEWANTMGPAAPAVGTSSPVRGHAAMQSGQRLEFYDATLAAWRCLDVDNGAVRVAVCP